MSADPCGSIAEEVSIEWSAGDRIQSSSNLKVRMLNELLKGLFHLKSYTTDLRSGRLTRTKHQVFIIHSDSKISVTYSGI